MKYYVYLRGNVYKTFLFFSDLIDDIQGADIPGLSSDIIIEHLIRSKQYHLKDFDGNRILDIFTSVHYG